MIYHQEQSSLAECPITEDALEKHHYNDKYRACDTNPPLLGDCLAHRPVGT